MIFDSITEEIRAIRHALAAQYDNDLDRIFDAVLKSQRESGQKYISLPPRPARMAVVAKSTPVSSPAAQDASDEIP